MPRVFTIEQLIAEYPELHLGRKAITGWIHTKQLPAFKLGNATSRWLIEEHEWRTFIERRKAMGQAS